MYFLKGFLSIVLNISTKKHHAQNQTNLKEKILYLPNQKRPRTGVLSRQFVCMKYCLAK